MKVLHHFEESLKQAADILRAGGTVVYPTETAYALGADPRNPEAVKKVFAIKGRDDGKPMGLVAGSLQQVEQLCVLSDVERKFAVQFWPGALSMVLALRTNLLPEWYKGLSLTTARLGTISIRVSSHPSARKLAELLGSPIIATSANRSGSGECYSAEEAQKQLADDKQPDLLLDGGTLTKVLPSTVVLFRDHKPVVVRQGPVVITNS